MGIFSEAFEREPPADPMLWHKWNVLWPTRTITIWWTFRKWAFHEWAWGYVWRRKTLDGRWEYRRRPETEDQQLDRMSW